jgi:hypothetical protein
MSDTEIELGPIDYLIVEWPPGKQPDGKGLEHLTSLVERGIITVIDLAFVTKDESGAVAGLALADIDGDGSLDLLQYEGASSGVLAEDDYQEAGAALEPGASAAILVYENRWAAPFATALLNNGAQVVAGGRIPVDALLAALDDLEATTV